MHLNCSNRYLRVLTDLITCIFYLGGHAFLHKLGLAWPYYVLCLGFLMIYVRV